MRILLASNASYAPPRGGSTRSNLVWLAHLARSGHTCRVISAALSSAETSDVETVSPSGVSILSVRDLSRRTGVLAEQIRDFHPDWVLVSSEDLGHMLLREAHHAAPARLIYLAHTPQFFPFGPASWNPDSRGTDIVRSARAVVAIGHHAAQYIRQHSGCLATVIHPPIYGEPPFARYGWFGRGFILMINPCEVKGIRIFLRLAERFWQHPFAALAGWGTTNRDRQALEKLPNVRLLESVPGIEQVLSGARLLLMPSLWYEGFGLIAMEAMLRGLPVIASDSGGLVEAKQGTGFVIPVRPIERYEPVFDENHMPKPVQVEQNIEPWAEALETLLTNEKMYDAESTRSREAGLRFVSGVRASAFEEMLESLQPECRAMPGPSTRRAMRILLAHNSLYYPSHGGGDRSNRLLMEALAARGHRVWVIARIGKFGSEGHEKLRGYLARQGVAAEVCASGAVRMSLNGVEVHTLTLDPHMRAYLSAQIAEFDPDIIVTSTDDPAQLLFEIAAGAGRARLVHLVRATIAVPFGPDSSMPSAARTAMLKRADGIVGVSEYVACYVRQWGGLDAIYLPISLPEPGECPALGRFENPFVLMVNPCAVKGISIFLALADRMPSVQFAAVPTWGTNAEDLAALRGRPNVSILEPADRIDEILRETKVLLVPSVWAEARSRIVVEAMSRGVPVIASDVGGIPEAKLGIDYLIPVRPIVRYKPAVDENMVPVAEVPEQDIGPWQGALERLVRDRAHYEELSSASRHAALDYLRTLSVEPFETFLARLLASPKRVLTTPAPGGERLSADKQRLLALRLRQKAAARGSRWFPYVEEARRGMARLFCFPYAGGGALEYGSWRGALATRVAICPVRLPGRETRLGEQPFDRMQGLVEALADEMILYQQRPFLFFGHSMGAAIAFELTRLLRRRGRPLPTALVVSGARAPQFRLGHLPQPEPGEEEFLDQLRRLDGIPEELLDNPELMRIAVPALRADARLYRNYVYMPEAPLSIPIFAYGGQSDPNVRPEHLEAWREQTTSSFCRREFAGGHFFFRTRRDEFLRALDEDIQQGSAS